MTALHTDWLAGQSGHVTEHNQISARLLDVCDFGAAGDGVIDDTATIQAAVDYADVHGGAIAIRRQHIVAPPGIMLHNNTGLYFDDGATLKAKQVNFQGNGILNILGIGGVRIRGNGILDGNKAENPVGMIVGTNVIGSQDIKINDLTIKNMPGSTLQGYNNGDGIYIDISSDVWIKRTKLDGNVRQGISLVGGRNIHILENQILNTSGNAPGCGIDLEVSHVNDLLTDIFIEDNYFSNNNNAVNMVSNINDRRVMISRNFIDTQRGINLSLNGSGCTAQGNILYTSGVIECCIFVGAYAIGNHVMGNQLFCDGSYRKTTGILAYNSTNGNAIKDNFIKGFTNPGIYLWNDNEIETIKNYVITGNILVNCATHGLTTPMIFIREASTGDILNVIVRENMTIDNRVDKADYGIRVIAKPTSIATYVIKDNFNDGPVVALSYG